MRKSSKITLSLLATLCMTAACNNAGKPQQLSVAREQYRTKEDCLKDWNDEKDCEQPQQQGGRPGYWHGPRYFYHGGMPYIYSGPDTPPRPIANTARFASVPQGGRSALSVGSSTQTAHVSGTIARGGFGRSAMAHSAGS